LELGKKRFSTRQLPVFALAALAFSPTTTHILATLARIPLLTTPPSSTTASGADPLLRLLTRGTRASKMPYVAYSAVHSAQDAARAALTRAAARLFCFPSGQRSVQLAVKMGEDGGLAPLSASVRKTLLPPTPQLFAVEQGIILAPTYV